MSESTADIIARLSMRLQPHAASPVTASRKDTDTPPPAGVREGYGTRRSTMANRRNGGASVYYRPRAADYAGRLPATTVPSAPSVKPASNGTRVARDRIAAGMPLDDARVTGTDNGYRQWCAARANLQRDAGDDIGTGESYPREITARGNLGPSARY